MTPDEQDERDVDVMASITLGLLIGAAVSSGLLIVGVCAYFIWRMV